MFRVMENTLRLPNHAGPCLAAFARRAVPGRIFVEAKTLQDAARVASGIDKLNSSQLRMVVDDKRLEVLCMDPAPRPQLQGWVRLRGQTKKLRRYQGDLALVVGLTGSNLLDLWLLPRLDFNLGEDASTPPAQLFNVDGVRASLGEDSVRRKQGNKNFIFQKNEYSSQGYLVLSKKEMYICEEFEAIPTEKELDSFLGCEALRPETLVKTRRRMESAKITLDDRVKVLCGAFRGLLGKVVGLTVEEAEVHLPSQDLTERMKIWELAREFRVGDRVRARIGNSESGVEIVRVGWVTKVSGSHVSVFDSVDSSEVREHSISNFHVLIIYRSPLPPFISNFMKTRSLFLSDVPVDRLSIGMQ